MAQQHARRRARQRGGSGLNTILAVLILGGMIFAAWKIVPPYFANYQLQDSLETEARFALVNKKTEDSIRTDVFKRMQELGIPGKKDDIRIVESEGLVTISLNYSVPVDLQVYQFKLDFHPHADNRTI